MNTWYDTCELALFPAFTRLILRLFDAAICLDQFSSARTSAWVDKSRALLVHFDIKKIYSIGSHFLALALINLRNSFA